MRKSWVPARLTGAIDNTLSRWQDLFDLLDDNPGLWASLRTQALMTKTEGRPRMVGEWALVYLAFANSAEREMLRWYRAAPDELWQRAGFVQTPSYHAAYKNFIVLESHEAAFRAVAAKLIQGAVEQSGGKVGHAVHIDGTEAETHSRLIHDCTGNELAKCSKQTVAPRRSTPADVQDERHRVAQEIPSEEELTGAVDEMAADERGLRVLVGGCWYRLSDAEAGIRAYISGNTVKRFWAGYYSAKAVDHYTGAVLAVHVTSASVQEYHAYPDLYAQLKENLGTKPQAVIADRGYSVSSIFELHTRDGVASVIPWRAHWHEPIRQDHLPRYDRHGIPHCAHCGGESVFYRFQHDAGPTKSEPRLWFRCAMPGGPDCQRIQSMLCKENWRLLLPLWRTSTAYQVLKVSHNNYEAAHHRWRERYAVAGDTKADRPKRRGIGVQQLRASASLVIEWLTVCHRQGWLGGPVLNDRSETILSREKAASYCGRIRARRHALGLVLGDPAKIPEHQAEVAKAYGNSASGFGAGSAYGSTVSFDAKEVIALLEPEEGKPPE